MCIRVSKRFLLYSALGNLVVLLYLWFYYRDTLTRYVTTLENTQLETNSSQDCLGGIVTVQDGGRLGNKIFEFASAWSLAKIYKLKLFVPNGIYSAVYKVFEDMDVKTIESFVDDLRKRESAKCGHINVTDILKTAAKYETLYPIDDFVNVSKMNGGPIVLGGGTILEDAIVPLAKQLKKEVRFRSKYAQIAQKTLAGIRNNLTASVGNEKEVLFVGVHIRRTDYSNYVKKNLKATEIANVDYYRHAVSWLRTTLHEDAGEPVNVAVVLVSDDLPWCRQQLTPALYLEEANRTQLGGLWSVSGWTWKPKRSGGRPCVTGRVQPLRYRVRHVRHVGGFDGGRAYCRL